MKQLTKWFVSLFVLVLPAAAYSQAISIYDTVYTPPGYSDGSLTATMFVPEVRNGIGVVLVHGAGGVPLNNKAWCDTLAAYGYVAMSIHYPDPAVSNTATYPKKARAAKIAVEFLRRNAQRFGISTGKIVGWGMSQGAHTWGEAIIWDNDDAYFQTDPLVNDHIDAVVLLYGWYDPDFSNPGVQYYFGGDSSRYLKGKAVAHIANISTPVLLVHGTADFAVPYQRSVQFHDSLVAYGKSSQLELFSGQPHGFDLNFRQVGNVYEGYAFSVPGLIAKDTALAFLKRVVGPKLKVHVSTPTIDFANIVVSERETTLARVGNIGFGPLVVNSITKGRPEFALLGLPSFPTTIPEGGAVDFKIVFQPSGNGIFEDTVLIQTDDSLAQSVRINVRGNGVARLAAATIGVLYTTARNGLFLSTNTATGAIQEIGSLGVSEIYGMAIRNSDHIIYGVSTTPFATTLYRINSATGEAVRDRVLPVGNLRTIAFSLEDTLYGATTGGSLYRFDLTTGRVDSIGTNKGLTYYGLAFRPKRKQLWASVRLPIDSIFILNTQNGIASFVGVTGFNALTFSLSFDALGRLYGLIDNGSGENYLALIDTANGSGKLAFEHSIGNGLLAITIRADSIATSVWKMAEVADGYHLSQNYPNPFNPSTEIQFSQPQKSHVTLTIFDLLGREVTTLVSEELSAGSYSTRWNATGMPSGVYLYRLRARGFVETKKLLLLR